jgi:hypothetical protein
MTGTGRSLVTGERDGVAGDLSGFLVPYRSRIRTPTWSRRAKNSSALAAAAAQADTWRRGVTRGGSRRPR